MSGNLKLNTTSGGSIALTPENTASTITVTVPAVTATLLNNSTGVMNIGSGQLVKDASGRVLVGSSTARANLFNATTTASLQVEGTTADNSTVLAIRNTDTAAAGSFCILARARGSAVGSTTIVQDGDAVGSLSFQSSDGSEFVEAARIQAIVSGTPGANDMPGALVFNTTADGAASSTERMRLDSSGNLLVGTTTSPGSPNAQIVASGTADAGIQLASTNGGGSLILAPGGAGAAFYTYTGAVGSESYSERMRITSDGNLLVGTTDTGFNTRQLIRFSASGTSTRGLVVWNGGGAGAQFIGFSNSGGAIIGSITSSGEGAVAYNTSSDYRLKENVQPMQGALDKVAALKPVTYTWKADGSEGQGFIAHELQAVVPDCVTGEKDAVDENGNPQYQGVDTSFLVATLVSAIQELKAEVDALKGAA
jgi:hypothetical protein